MHHNSQTLSGDVARTSATGAAKTALIERYWPGQEHGWPILNAAARKIAASKIMDLCGLFYRDRGSADVARAKLDQFERTGGGWPYGAPVN